jgi:catechol 2,3-dioxygenase-like lactoylglutathione lyase family enzyme
MKAVRAKSNESSIIRTSRAFASFSATDLKAAKQFYGETLGLEISETPEGLEMNLEGGTTVFIYPKSDHTPATFTVLNFAVDEIDEAVAELKRLGVALEHYDLPGLKTDEDGIMRGDGPKVAWFKDPSGNILSVVEDNHEV